MKILSLKLRGSIGIKKGTGLDEIQLDLTKFGPGIIVLTGKNGAGKSSILEQLHPYRQMVSRTGSLQSHFFLKDSYRILEFEYAGIIYKSKILIDALTGGSEAYLMQGTQAMNDGKLTTYDEAITKLLGSPALFFNSIFSGQKSKGIAELKPADRKKLCFELLNLDHYETLCNEAKTEQRNAELKIAQIDGEARSLINSGETMESLESKRLEVLEVQAERLTQISDYQTDAEQIQKDITAAEVLISECKRLVEDEAEWFKRDEANKKATKALNAEMQMRTDQHEITVAEYNRVIERALKLTENRHKIDSALSEIEALTVKRTELSSVLDELKSIEVLLSKKHSAWLERKSEHTTELNRLEAELKRIEQNIKNADNNISESKSQAEIIGQVPCDETVGKSCQFLINAFKRRETIPEVLEIQERQIIERLNKQNEFNTLAKQLVDEQAKFNESYNAEEDQRRNSLQETNKKLTPITERYNELKRTNWASLKEQAAKADTEIVLTTQAIEAENKAYAEMLVAFGVRAEALENELKLIIEHTTFEITPSEKLQIAKNKLQSLLEIKESNANHLKAAEASLSDAEKELAKIETAIQEQERITVRLSELDEAGKKARAELKDWSFLAKAFDKTGIPILKLENSGVEITTIANDLLSMFDNKFRIVFETTALTKDKKKQKETFDINIIDEDGICEISNKSGGQQVWLETAIQLAISLVVRNQGRRLQTAFLDEKDGALDLDNAYNYIAMLKKAHELSKVHNTFIITHRTELLDMIEQKIIVRDGSVEVVC